MSDRQLYNEKIIIQTLMDLGGRESLILHVRMSDLLMCGNNLLFQFSGSQQFNRCMTLYSEETQEYRLQLYYKQMHSWTLKKEGVGIKRDQLLNAFEHLTGLPLQSKMSPMHWAGHTQYFRS